MSSTGKTSEHLSSAKAYNSQPAAEAAAAEAAEAAQYEAAEVAAAEAAEAARAGPAGFGRLWAGSLSANKRGRTRASQIKKPRRLGRGFS